MILSMLFILFTFLPLKDCMMRCREVVEDFFHSVLEDHWEMGLHSYRYPDSTISFSFVQNAAEGKRAM